MPNLPDDPEAPRSLRECWDDVRAKYGESPLFLAGYCYGRRDTFEVIGRLLRMQRVGEFTFTIDMRDVAQMMAEIGALDKEYAAHARRGVVIQDGKTNRRRGPPRP